MSISSSYPVSMLMPPLHFVGEEVASQGGEVSPPVGHFQSPGTRHYLSVGVRQFNIQGHKGFRAVHEDKVRT